MTAQLQTRGLRLASLRDAFGEALADLGSRDERIVVVDADIGDSTRTFRFAKKFPNRFINVGISEQDMICTAVGLSLAGLVSVTSTYSAFISRCFDQIRYSVAFHRANVKLVTTHSGITVGEDGPSAHGINDLAIMRSVPGYVVMVPADDTSTRACLEYCCSIDGPTYLRLTRQDLPVIYEKAGDFTVEKASVVMEGSDVSIVAIGPMLSEGLGAAALLKGRGISAEVVDMHLIKPIDEDALLKSAMKTGCIVTAEDHSIIGGLGSAVAEVLSEKRPTRMTRIGLQDRFAESGKAADLMVKYAMDSAHIAEAAEGLLKGSRG